MSTEQLLDLVIYLIRFFSINQIINFKDIIMDTQDYNKAENAVEKARWTINEYAEKAKAYIREKRDNNEEPTREGWIERAKNNAADAWENTQDAISDAWDKAKDYADGAWEKTKDAAEDVKSEFRKSTN